LERRAQQRQIQNVCLMLLSAVAAGFVFFWFRSVLIPFVLAVFFAYGLGPLVDVQILRLRIPRPLAVLVTLLLGVLLLGMIGGLISMSVRQLSDNAFDYQQNIEQIVDQVMRSPLLDRLGLDPEISYDIRSLVPTEKLGSLLVGTTNAIVDMLSKGFIVLIFLFFLLMGGALHDAAASGVRAEVERKIRRYIVIQGLVSAVTGFLIGTILMVLGVPLAMTFGLCAFLLNFIPNIGSILATLLPLPIVLVSPEISTTVAVLAILLPGLVQLGIGNVIAPKVLGDSLDLDPVTILLALMIWGTLWGVVGMLLATPITAVMKILFERTELTAPLAQLMASRRDPHPAR
jgi:AI-2 transport protein TqsA